MNTFKVVKTIQGEITYFEIEVDGKLLAHHFAGRLGAHPSEISPLGYSSASVEYRKEVVSMFLADKPSNIESDRVPVLVCPECGDIGCGSFAVHIKKDNDFVIWSDWAYENGYEEASELTWPTQPIKFIFNRELYESELRKTL